jgi:hypothetical protein
MKRVLKKLFIIWAIVLAVPMIAALFISSEYRVDREIVINRSTPEVFDYVKHLKNQGEYSVWSMMDPDMKKTFTGTDATVGFVAAWSSDNKEVGVGEQEIKAMVENERLDFELRFFEPFEATDSAYMTTTPVGVDQTKVAWGFNGKMKYPSNIMLLFLDIEEMVGDALQTSLENLKGVLEKE